jgi:hypothetical protein
LQDVHVPERNESAAISQLSAHLIDERPLSSQKWPEIAAPRRLGCGKTRAAAACRELLGAGTYK